MRRVKQQTSINLCFSYFFIFFDEQNLIVVQKSFHSDVFESCDSSWFIKFWIGGHTGWIHSGDQPVHTCRVTHQTNLSFCADLKKWMFFCLIITVVKLLLNSIMQLCGLYFTIRTAYIELIHNESSCSTCYPKPKIIEDPLTKQTVPGLSCIKMVSIFLFPGPSGASGLGPSTNSSLVDLLPGSRVWKHVAIEVENDEVGDASGLWDVFFGDSLFPIQVI